MSDKRKRGRPRNPERTIEPLAVSVAEACRIIDCGRETLYTLMRSGEVESYLDGASRKITYASIKARHARLLAAQKNSFTPRTNNAAAIVELKKAAAS